MAGYRKTTNTVFIVTFCGRHFAIYCKHESNGYFWKDCDHTDMQENKQAAIN